MLCARLTLAAGLLWAKGGATRQRGGHKQQESDMVRKEGTYQGVAGEEAK